MGCMPILGKGAIILWLGVGVWLIGILHRSIQVFQLNFVRSLFYRIRQFKQATTNFMSNTLALNNLSAESDGSRIS